MKALKPCGIRKALSTVGGTNIKIKFGYGYASGFFDWNNQLYYFTVLGSVNGVRTPVGKELVEGEYPLMYRTAKDRNDYRGGINQWDFNKILHTYGLKLCKG